MTKQENLVCYTSFNDAKYHKYICINAINCDKCMVHGPGLTLSAREYNVFVFKDMFPLLRAI